MDREILKNRNKDLMLSGDVSTFEWRQTFCSNLKAKEIGILKIRRGHWILGMSWCCKIQSFWVPLKWDLSMTLSPAKSLSVSSAEEFLSEMEPSIMRPRNLIGLEWMEGMEDETSGWSDAFDTEKGVVLIDLTLTMTIDHDLSPLNSRPAQVRAVMHWERRFWLPKTVENIRLRPSIKAPSKGNAVLLVVNWGTLACSDYSNMFIPAKKRIIERLQPVKIHCWCLCQELVADWENDLLKIPS